MLPLQYKYISIGKKKTNKILPPKLRRKKKKKHTNHLMSFLKKIYGSR